MSKLSVSKCISIYLFRLCIKPGIQERGTECEERDEYGECYIPGNVAKHSGECPQTFRGMSSNIPRNVAKHSRECPQTFRGMSPNIPGNVLKHSGECRQIFRGMSPNIPGKNNIWHVACSMWHVVKHSVESMKDFGWMYIIALDTGDYELYLFVEEPLLLKSNSNQLG